jgi:hypothetical protein
MTRYEDDGILLGEDQLTIKSYRWGGNARRIAYRSVRSFEVFEMGLWTGRFRMVGISVGRPRNWIPWGRSRTNKSTAISLDVGKWLRPTIVPDDPAAVDGILRGVVETEKG